MKKFLLFTILALSLHTVSAQQFQFGLKAGANISNFSGGNFDQVKKSAYVGFHGGLYMR